MGTTKGCAAKRTDGEGKMSSPGLLLDNGLAWELVGQCGGP